MTRSMRPAPKSALGMVIERLIFEEAFRALLIADPGAALAGFRLNELEVVLLAELLSEPKPSMADGTLVRAALDRFVAEGGLAALGIIPGPDAPAQRAS